MRKEDLKAGMIIELNNGTRYLLINTGDKGNLIGVRLKGWTDISSYREDLTNNHSSIQIDAVYTQVGNSGFEFMLANTSNELLWRRNNCG